MTEFLSMGGYGAYVWSAYGVVAFALVYMALSSRKEARKIKQQLNELE